MQTPSFLFQENDFISNIHAFQGALKRSFGKGKVAYSVKTNSLPYIIRKAYENGCYIEVTSLDEYQLAKAAGVSVDCIVYNGPYKDRETFIEAVNGSAVVVIQQTDNTASGKYAAE